MSERPTPETDALEHKQLNEGCPQWNDMMRWVRENAALARKIERERDEALGAMSAQDKRMKAAGKKCGIPFEVFGCDWPDQVAEELIAVAKERDEARLEAAMWALQRDEAREAAAKWESVALREASINGARRNKEEKK